MSCFKFGYTHINKCAGTSVHHWLTANNILPAYGSTGDHLAHSGTALLSFDPKIVNIVTVRNPYNRIYSIFKQWEKNGWIKNDMKLPEFIRLLPECYEENNCGKIVGVYENWLGTPPDESPVGIRMIKPCSYWLKGLNKFKIFKLENLQTLQDFFINNCKSFILLSYYY